jgi:hypothetical protein
MIFGNIHIIKVAMYEILDERRLTKEQIWMVTLLGEDLDALFLIKFNNF